MCKYHNMNLYPQLTTYRSVTSEVINSKIKSTRLQAVTKKIFCTILFTTNSWTIFTIQVSLRNNITPCNQEPSQKRLSYMTTFIVLCIPHPKAIYFPILTLTITPKRTVFIAHSYGKLYCTLLIHLYFCTIT